MPKMGRSIVRDCTPVKPGRFPPLGLKRAESRFWVIFFFKGWRKAVRMQKLEQNSPIGRRLACTVSMLSVVQLARSIYDQGR
jgi:hypothetical protein